MGWLGDRLGRNLVWSSCFVFYAAGFGAFCFLSPSRIWLLPIVLTLVGLGNAANLIGSQPSAADYFGMKRYATIRGLMHTMTVPGSLLVPLFIGWTADSTGDYRLAYGTIGALALSGLIALRLIRRPKWDEGPRPAAKPPQSVEAEATTKP